MIITSTHGNTKKLQSIYQRLVLFFNNLKAIAPQLTLYECWCHILAKAMEKFKDAARKTEPIKLPLAV